MIEYYILHQKAVCIITCLSLRRYTWKPYIALQRCGVVHQRVRELLVQVVKQISHCRCDWSSSSLTAELSAERVG